MWMTVHSSEDTEQTEYVILLCFSLWSRCCCLCPCWSPPFECVLLPVFCFSGRGMALSFLLLSSAMLPLLSESAYNTSAGNDCAVSHTSVSLWHNVSSCHYKTIGWCSTMDAVCACRLLICCMFACIFICVGFIWQQNVSWCLLRNSFGVYVSSVWLCTVYQVV